MRQLYLKSDVILITDVFENFIKVPIKEFNINPLYCVSLLGNNWQCGLKYTKIKLQTLQDEDLIFTLKNSIRGGISSVMGDRYVVSDEKKKILYNNANNLYGWAMSQKLLYDEIEMWHRHLDLYMDKMGDSLNTEDDSGIGYFVEVELKYPDKIKQKTKNSPFAPEKKIHPHDKFTEYMNKNKPNIYTKSTK